MISTTLQSILPKLTRKVFLNHEKPREQERVNNRGPHYPFDKLIRFRSTIARNFVIAHHNTSYYSMQSLSGIYFRIILKVFEQQQYAMNA